MTIFSNPQLLRRTSFLLLFISVFLVSSAQIVHLKSGDFDIRDNQISQITEDNKDIVFDGYFYGIVSVEKTNQIDPSLISAWLSPNLVIARLVLPLESIQNKRLYQLTSKLKIDPLVQDSLIPKTEIKLNVTLHHFTESIKDKLTQLGEIGRYNPLNQSVIMNISADSFQSLIALPFVYWVELPAPTLETNNLLERTSHRVPLLTNFSTSHQLTGKGVVMGEWDGGGADDHIDYDYRHTRIDPFINNLNGRHATHVAGTMLGAGIKDPLRKGMAPEATFYSYDFYGSVTSEMDSASRKYGIELTQNSYSYGSNGDVCSRRGTYDNTSVALDRLVRKYPNLLHVFAAGNSRRSNCRPGGYGTVHSGYQASKNSIAVAAITFTDGNSSFHCYGPLRDGRLKPEISAVGVNVNSTFPNNQYRGGYSGTSMACPGTSGTAALITQLYKEKFKTKPDAHLIKGALCNGADELGRSGPDYQYGFGRLNGFNAANIIDKGNFDQDSVNQNGTKSDTIFIDNPHIFKVMLCYDDVQGSSASSTALVNDLDLTITDDAGNIVRPWVLNPNSPTAVATRGVDNLNNIEQVTVTAPTSKYYIYTVRGANINSGYQKFSVNWLELDTSIRIVYPNGGEKWLPPSSASRRQTIRWDAYGLSGNGVLSYSTDSGSTWSVISSSVNLSRGYYNWQNCPSTVVTGQALVKIEKGSYSDTSNGIFDIFSTGPTASATPCSKQLHITWNPIQNATGYNIYMNVEGEMKKLGYTSELSYTIRNLSNSLSYWVSISAVASNGAEGPRSIAQEFTPDATKLPPSFPISPSDRTICSGSNAPFFSSVTGPNLVNENWQISNDNGNSWSNISGATSSFYTVNRARIHQDGNLYRYTASNGCLSLESSESAILRVDTVLPYEYQENEIKLCPGQDTVFRLKEVPNLRGVADWYFLADSSTQSILLVQNSDLSYPKSSVGVADRGVYYAALKNACGLQQNNKRIRLNVSDTLNLSIIGEDSLCIDQDIINEATASGGDTSNYDFFWNLDTLISIQSPFLSRSIDSSEVWMVGVFDNCSEDTVYQERKFIFRSLPDISLPMDTTICKGMNIDLKLNISGGHKPLYHYAWRNENTNQELSSNHPTISVNPEITTRYSVIFTDSCSRSIDSASILVRVREALKAEIISSKDTLCTNEKHTLSVTGSGGDSDNYTFTWEDGSTNASREISSDSDSTYLVTLTDNCTIKPSLDSIKIKVRPPLSISISGLDTLCLGETSVYSAVVLGGYSKGYSYDWTKKNSPSLTIIGAIDTLLTLEVTDGCTPKAANITKPIIIREKLTLTAFEKVITACHGESIELNVNPSGGKSTDYNLFWDIGLTNTNGITKRWYSDTTVQVTLSDGCTALDADLLFNINVLPPLTLNPLPDIRTCKFQEESIDLIGAGGKPSDFRFFVNEVAVGGNSISQNFLDSTRFTIRLTDNCSEKDALDTFWVEVKPITPLIFDIQQENLIVKAKTLLDGAVNLWGTDVNNLSEFPDNTAEIRYSNYGPATLCLRKIDDFGCSDTNCTNLLLYDVFSTQNIEATIYPNPTNENLNISLNKVAGKVSIDLYTSEGKSVWENSYTTYDKQDFQFDVSHLAPGIYILDIEVNGEIIREKVLIE